MDFRDLLGEFLDDVWGKGLTPRNTFLAHRKAPLDFSLMPPVEWPTKRDKVIDFVQTANARELNVYYNPAMFDFNAESNEKDNVWASIVLWCDFDGNANEARAKLAATPGLPRPSWELQTGQDGHEHWYWILDRPAAPQDFEPVNRKLAYYLDADNCWNANRVMRLPYTTNYMDAPKYTGTNLSPQPVDFLKKNDTRYKLSDFDVLPDVKTSIVESIEEPDKVPPIADVIAKYKWDDAHWDVFKNPPVLGKGDRSGALMKLAFFGAELGMSNEEIYAILIDVDDRIKKYKYREDRPRRLAQTIAKAREKYPYGAGAAFIPSDEPLQQVYTFNELMRSEFKIEWLVDNLFVARTINFLSAESGIGKSRLAMQLAMAMATGTQFLKWPITRKMRVLYVSLEMTPDMVKHFGFKLNEGNELPDEDSDNFKFYAPGQALDIVTEASYELIDSYIEIHQPQMVMIDAMGKLTFDELGEVQAKNINNQLNRLIQKHNTTFLVIHHNRKPDLSGKKRPGLGDVYGNQYVVTDASTVLTMFMPDNQAHVELIFAKSRAMEADDYIVMNGKGQFKFRIKEKGETADYEPNWDFSQS